MQPVDRVNIGKHKETKSRGQVEKYTVNKKDGHSIGKIFKTVWMKRMCFNPHGMSVEWESQLEFVSEIGFPDSI